MTTYKTSEVATIIGVHPNTIRLYEEAGLITKPERAQNGYRIFTNLQVEQCKLVRLAFQVEIVRNGLRRKITNVAQACAQKDFDSAIKLTDEYLEQISYERKNAEEAIEIVKQLLSGDAQEHTQNLKRKEVSKVLNISVDALRNWEMNGLLTVKRKENGYRVYTDDDIRRLKIIRVLRCASYSLEAILRLMNSLNENPNTDIFCALNNPSENDDIISVCDRLILSLSQAEQNAYKIRTMLQNMKSNFI